VGADMLCELLVKCSIFLLFFHVCFYFSYFWCSNFLFSYFLEPMCCLTPCVSIAGLVFVDHFLFAKFECFISCQVFRHSTLLSFIAAEFLPPTYKDKVSYEFETSLVSFTIVRTQGKSLHSVESLSP